MARRALLAAVPMLGSTLGCELIVGIEDREISPTARIEGAVTDLVSGVELDDVQLCVAEHERCVRSNGRGRFSLPAPAGEEHRITLRRDAYLSQLAVVSLGEDDLAVDAAMVREDLAVGMFEAGGYTYDPAGSHVAFLVLPPGADLTVAEGAEGYTAQLDPPAGTGPLFFEGTRAADTGSTDTSGVGAFLDVPPGSYEVVVEGPEPCHPRAVSPGPEPGRYRAPVERGYLTVVVARCGTP